MMIRDYERMAPPKPTTRPYELEGQLAQARQADTQTDLHSNRFSSIRPAFSGVFQAVLNWGKAVHFTRYKVRVI